MKILEAIRNAVCNYADYEKKIKEKEQEIYNKDLEIKTIIIESTKISLRAQSLQEKLNHQVQFKELEEAKQGLTELDQFCIAKHQIVEKAYKDKIIINGVKMPCDLREMFTPMSFVVQQFKKRILKSEDKIIWYKNIMSQTHAVVKWTDDGRDDNYYFPCYTITTKAGDCDDMANIQVSVEPELGNAFGFWKQNNKSIGHSFAVGLVNGNIHIFDAVKGQSEQYIEGGDYEINFIITKNNIYKVKGGIEFGEILWN